MTEGLYFIAIVPDKELRAEVDRFKRIAKERFGSGHALKSPPHITLIPPFRWRKADMPALVRCLGEFCDRRERFTIRLHQFDAFPPRVLFIGVAQNPVLRKTQADLEKEMERKTPWRKKDGREYHPHMTIAFRDLKKTAFREAWAFFRQLDFDRTFWATALTLLEHNGQRWEINKEFPFNKGSI